MLAAVSSKRAASPSPATFPKHTSRSLSGKPSLLLRILSPPRMRHRRGCCAIDHDYVSYGDASLVSGGFCE